MEYTVFLSARPSRAIPGSIVQYPSEKSYQNAMGSFEVYFALFVGFRCIDSVRFQALGFLLLLFGFGLCEGGRDAFI